MIKTPKILPWILVGALAVLAIFLLVRKPSGPDEAYWVSRAEYDQNVADMEKGLQETFRLILERDKIIKQQDEFVALGQRKIMELEDAQKKTATDGRVLADENKRLKADAAAVIAANPAVRLLIENYDLRCENYEKQIFNLSQGWAEEKKVSEAKDVKILAITYQRDAWKKSWEDEHATRLVSDKLRIGLEKQVSNGKIWKWVAIGSNVLWGALAIAK